MEIGDKVYVCEIKLDFDNKRVEQIIKSYKIIGINEYRFVIDDLSFTAIAREEKAYGDGTLDKVVFIDFTDLAKYGYLSGILRTMKADEKAAYKKVKRELGKYVRKKLSRYGGAVDLLNQIEI